MISMNFRKKISFYFILVSIVTAIQTNLYVQPRKILVTACNDRYFKACLTLIASIHRTSLNIVDEIRVYNLGLSEQNKTVLRSLKKVKLLYFEDLKDSMPDIDIPYFYTQIRQFAWKSVCVNNPTYQDGDLIFYLDSGAIFIKSAAKIYEKIEKDEIFLVDDYWKNYQWTHFACINSMHAIENELKAHQLCAGIQGHKRGGKYQKVFDEFYKYSSMKECIHGEHYYDYGVNIAGEHIKGHRQDQSILSILAVRYNCPVQVQQNYIQFQLFGDNALNKGYIFVHRNNFFDHSGLKYIQA